MTKMAIDAKHAEGFYVYPEDLVLVGLDTPDKAGTHELYDERVHDPVDEAMVSSILEQGILQNIVVRRATVRLAGGGLEPRYEVLLGRGRTKAARAINARIAEGKIKDMERIRVPVTLRKADPAGALGALIAENEIRRSDSPLNRARKAQRMLDLGAKPAQVATAFGVTAHTVIGWTKLLGCSAPVLKAVEAGKVSASAVVALADLPPAEQLPALEKIIEETGGKATAEAVSRGVERSKRAPAEEDDEPVKGPPSRRLLNKIVAADKASKIDVTEKAMAVLRVFQGSPAEGDDGLLGDEVYKALRWLSGEGSERAVKGLHFAINYVSNPPKEKK